MTDAGSDDAPAVERTSGNLAPVALGLGIAGLLMGLIPFYGTFFALPLSVVAIVLGLTARGRRGESRRQATAGLVTGTIGLVAVVVWAGWFAWGQLGFGSFTSQTELEVGTGRAVAPRVDVQAEPPSPSGEDPDAHPPTVVPGETGDELIAGLSGQADVTVGDQAATLELTDCALSDRTNTGTLLRGEGPEGRLAVAQPDLSGLIVDLEIDDGPRGTYLGTVTGMSSQGRGGGLIQDRRRFAIDGQLRDLHTDATVDISITATCS